jgi:hypothetical protein
MKLLILGSNFGRYHLIAAINSNTFSKISIASPNINKKKILNSINQYKNLKSAINNKERYSMLSITTPPFIQHKILDFIFKKKFFPKFLFLEKPILNKSILLLKKFPTKCLFLTNFIFSFNKKWIFFKKKIQSSSNINFFDYTWYFKQYYFFNKKKTWKINPKQGGGLVNYYLPHAIFNILNNFRNARFLKINKKRYYKNNLIYLDIIFLLNKKQCHLKISNNSKINLHKFIFISRNVKYTLVNNTKNWLSNFKVFKNNRQVYKIKCNNQKKDRVGELLNVYSNLKKYYDSKNILLNKNLTFKTFKIIDSINKKI